MSVDFIFLSVAAIYLTVAILFLTNCVKDTVLVKRTLQYTVVSVIIYCLNLLLWVFGELCVSNLEGCLLVVECFFIASAVPHLHLTSPCFGDKAPRSLSYAYLTVIFLISLSVYCPLPDKVKTMSGIFVMVAGTVSLCYAAVKHLMTEMNFWNYVSIMSCVIQGLMILYFFFGKGSETVNRLFIICYVIIVNIHGIKVLCSGKKCAAYPMSCDRKWALHTLEDGAPATPVNRNKIKEMLKDYLEKEKPFLEHDLRISDMAERLMTNKTTLCNVLNKEMHTNFRELLNYYRVKEAMKIYAGNDNLKMNDLCQMSGFGNFSTFTGAFKLWTGKTPGEWRKMVKQHKDEMWRIDRLAQAEDVPDYEERIGFKIRKDSDEGKIEEYETEKDKGRIVSDCI